MSTELPERGTATIASHTPRSAPDLSSERGKNLALMLLAFCLTISEDEERAYLEMLLQSKTDRAFSIPPWTPRSP